MTVGLTLQLELWLNCGRFYIKKSEKEVLPGVDLSTDLAIYIWEVQHRTLVFLGGSAGHGFVFCPLGC